MTEGQRAVEEAGARCLGGAPLTRREIIRLLKIPLGSPEDKLLRAAARQAAMALTGGKGYIWGALGADYDSCPMNCAFCSFGEKWGLIKERRVFDESEIIGIIQGYVAGGARFVVLRTTEFYRLEDLTDHVKRIRREVPGRYEIILNTGELTPDTAQGLHQAGVDGIYHACRLGEGKDTPFDPGERNATMESVRQSPLRLISLVEPVGPEHTDEEIADNFLNLLQYEPEISGAMARVPVRGTPLGEKPALDSSRLAQIIAVLRLSGGGTVKDICVHPASPEALSSGANVVVVETGAIPRDSALSPREWAGFDLKKAAGLLSDAGYKVSQT